MSLLFKSTNELCDVVSFVAYCADDGSMLVTLESNTSEFWIPSSKIEQSISWRKQIAKDIFDIFGANIPVKRILRHYKLWLPNFKFSYIQHCVFDVVVTAAQKKNLKNVAGKVRDQPDLSIYLIAKKQYRGKIRWATKDELWKNQAEYGLKSPELLDFYHLTRGQESQNYPLCEYYPMGNMIEITDEIIIKTKQGIYEQIVDSAGLNASHQEALYKEFLSLCFPSVFMGYNVFAKFAVDLGWPREEIIGLFRAADVNFRNAISFREFLFFMAVVEPNLGHGGAAAELRCRYIFRYFDKDKSGGLSNEAIRNLIIMIRKSKKEPLEQAKVNAEMDDAYKKMGFPQNHPLNIGEFLKAVGELKIRGTSQILRAPLSIIKYCSDLSEKESKGLQMSTKPAVNQVASYQGTKCQIKQAASVVPQRAMPVKLYTGYELAVHSIKIQKSGAAINIEPLYSLQNAVTDSTIKQSTVNDTNRRVSTDQFCQSSQSNELLKALRLLSMSNPKMQTYMKTEQLRYNWGQVDPATMAKHLISVCNQVKNVFAKEPRLIEVSSPVYILGDLHGNFTDLLYFERVFWHVGPCLCPCNLLFLGDYVDRGAYSIEVISYLFCYKIQTPHKLKLLRECKVKFGNTLGATVFNAVNDAFDTMPLAAIIDNKIFCCHGGIPPPWLCPVVAAINDIPVNLTEPLEQSPLAWELMWNDPVRPKLVTEKMAMELLANEGFATNTRRGTAHVFNIEALEKFLYANGFTHMIRAHEVVEAGFTVQQKGKLLTVFSSSKYCNGINEAACILADQGKLRILRLETL